MAIARKQYQHYFEYCQKEGTEPEFSLEDFEDNALKEDFPAMVRNFRAYVLERINGKSADPLT
jgi:hypothetical protein